MGTFTYGRSKDKKVIHDSAARVGLTSNSVANRDTMVDNITAMDRLGNWEQMHVWTAQNTDTTVHQTYQYIGNVFDGRYVYFAAHGADTFLRYDTNERNFTASGNWDRISMSAAQNATELNFAYAGAAFDGRYTYFSPYDSNTFIRFDSRASSFSTTTNWEQVSASDVLATLSSSDAYRGCTSDGRYVYFTPCNANTFVRYDSEGDFTATVNWDKISASIIQGGTPPDSAYIGNAFDGRYVYFTPHDSDTFIRFDTNNSFTATANWEQMSMSHILESTPGDAYRGCIFDGRYVYFVPYKATTIVRFDSQIDFDETSSWGSMSLSTAQDASATTYNYNGGVFDGRYVYFAPNSPSTFLRYDTQESFTNKNSWSTCALSTAQGSSSSGTFSGATFDGKYVYFTLLGTNTFVRFAGMDSQKGYGKLGG